MNTKAFPVARYPRFLIARRLRACGLSCAATAAAFNELSVLAKEVQALDNSSCSLVEKLLNAAAKRRSTTDRGALTSVPQHQDKGQMQHRRANPKEWIEEEPSHGLQGQQAWQQQQQEQQQRWERELFLFWSESTLQQKTARKGTDDIPKSSQTPGNRGGERLGEFTADRKVSAASASEQQAERVYFAAEAAVEAEVKAQALLSPYACASAAATARNGAGEARKAALAGSSGSVDGWQNTYPAAASAPQTSHRASAAVETSLMEIERLLVALQGLLNRLYTTALHARQIIDVLRRHLGPAQSHHAAAPPPPLPVTPAAPAAEAALRPPPAAPATAVSAASAAGARAAARTGVTWRAAKVSAEACAARGAKQEDDVESPSEGERRKEAEEVKAAHVEEDDGGENDAEHRCRFTGSCNGSTDEARRRMCDVPFASCGGTQPAYAGDKTTPEQSDQQQNEGEQQQQQQRPNIQGHKFTVNQQDVHVQENQQEGHREEQCHPKGKPQQRYPQPQRRSSHEHQSSQQEQDGASQQQRELPALAESPSAPQRHQQRRYEESRDQEEPCKHSATLLQLCEAVVKTIEGDWRFKQEVKEELHFDVPLSVFLAARAAWLAKPYVSDLGPFLRRAASLEEECSRSKHQQRAIRSSSDSDKQHYDPATAADTSSPEGGECRGAGGRRC